MYLLRAVLLARVTAFDKARPSVAALKVPIQPTGCVPFGGGVNLSCFQTGQGQEYNLR